MTAYCFIPRAGSLLVLLLFLLSVTLPCGGLMAQEAEVHGKVTDQEGEPLVGATVAAVGAVVGAFTDDEGHYQLEVASGRIRLVISYIGFENFDTTFTVAVPDREIEINAVLTDAFSDLPETQVIGRRAFGQAQALRLQQSGLCTQTIIHSETFNKYPDVTLAETVARMPGVSLIRDVSRGQLVQLRGLPERYTGVSLNGQRLPNIQPEDDQAGGLDIIQSNLVDEVRIIKSRTAEIDGDAIAGMVNFKVRQPEERFELLAQAAQGTNFGFNDNPGQFTGVTQLAGALNSEVSEEKVYFLAAGSYLKEGRGVRSQLFEYVDGDNQLDFARPFDENLLSEKIGFVGAVELRPSTYNRMRLSVNQSISRQDVERRQLHLPVASGATFRRTGTAFSTDRRMSLVALEVENNFPQTRLDYQLSYSDSNETLDGRRRNILESAGPARGGFAANDLTPYADLGVDMQETARLQQDAELNETVAIGSLNITRWLNQKRTSNLKLGGQFRAKDRTYGSVAFSQTINGGEQVGPTEFLPLLANRPMPAFVDPGTEAGELYGAKERVAAAYLMYSANYSAVWSLNAGLRYEYLSLETTDPFTPDVLSFDRSNLLPALNVVYRIRRDRQVRFSYYQALGRPNYGNFRPQAALPLIPLDQFNLSNQDLEFANSNNIDLTFERYGRRDGLLTVGLYYKTIDNPTVRLVESLNNPLTFTYQTQLVNTEAASVIGFETGLYQSLGAINQQLRHFNVNATYNFNVLSNQGADGTDQEVPLAQSPRQSANLSIVYANPERRINFVVAINYRDRFFDRFLNERAVWRNNLFSLDISADYEVIKNVSVFARANNLTDHPFEEWLGQPATEGSVLRSRANYGSWGLVGVRFSVR